MGVSVGGVDLMVMVNDAMVGGAKSRARLKFYEILPTYKIAFESLA